MNKIKAIIIDDERHSCEITQVLVDDCCPNVEVVGVTTSPIEGMRLIRQEKPDLLFLDIEMPVLNGFQLLEKIGKIDFHIIFTTAYDEFAIKAFKVGAVDYLLKPIDSGELEEAVSRVRRRMLEPNSMSHIESLLRNMQKKDKIDGRLTVPTLNGLEVLTIDDIIRCEADSNYTTLVLADREVVISKTLKDIEEQLKSYPFIRVHQSHLIHLGHVQKYIKGNGGQLVMDNGDYINVSRNRKQHLLDALAGK